MQRSRAETHDFSGLDDNDSIVRGFRAAVDEAARFIGATAPNPPVGCAILDAEGDILAVGAHHRAGQPHAEAMALQACRDAGLLHRAATAVVTLEPCNHAGRTGPCTEAILASPIDTVWIGVNDPNPRVAGGGEARLREAGLTVHRPQPGNEAARDCAALIAPFQSLMRAGRPWITVKQALDATGGMIPPIGMKTFTGGDALRLAHRLRRATDAIITGMGTILADNPAFTVRHVADHAQRRRILAVPDRGAALPAAFRQAAGANGFQLLTAPDLPSLLQALAREGVLWAMVEAGPRLLSRIRQESLWDDWLTIRHDAGGQDHASVELVPGSAHSTETPLRLIEGAMKGALCFPAS